MMQMEKSVFKDKQYFIFDLDGTLIDPRENHKQGIWNLVKKIMPERPNTYQTILEYLEEFGRRDREARRNAYAYCGITQGCCDIEAEELFRNVDLLYWQGVGQALKWVDGAEETLIELASRNKALSIVTNGGKIQHKKLELVKEKLPQLLVDFDIAIVTGDYGVEAYKPNPKCLNKVINFYKANRSEAIYIGDSISEDYYAAKNAGIDFVLVDYYERHADFEGLRIFDLRELYEY